MSILWYESESSFTCKLNLLYLLLCIRPRFVHALLERLKASWAIRHCLNLTMSLEMIIKLANFKKVNKGRYFYVGSYTVVHSFVLRSYAIREFLNMNVYWLVPQLLVNNFVFCVRSRPKPRTKTYSKEFCGGL